MASKELPEGKTDEDVVRPLMEFWHMDNALAAQLLSFSTVLPFVADCMRSGAWGDWVNDCARRDSAQLAAFADVFLETERRIRASLRASGIEIPGGKDA